MMRRSLAPIILASFFLAPILLAPAAKAAIAPTCPTVSAEVDPQGGSHPSPRGVRGRPSRPGRTPRGQAVSGAPEPGFYALLIAGGAGLYLLHRSRRRASGAGGAA